MKRWFPWLAGLGAVALYIITRLSSLTALPVFADEAIYIRWAQLIIHEPARYLFFSLNDGKPPLFVWSLIPFLHVFQDPLFAARFASAVFGVLQLGVNDLLVRRLGGKNLARLATAIVTLIAPFWFFHHRMGLMDSLLTLALSVSWLGLLMMQQSKERLPVWGVLTAGVGWGLALLTKTPALFFAPLFVVFAVAGEWLLATEKKKQTWNSRIFRLVAYAVAGALGLSIFLMLRISPAFGSLFGRSSDFTFTVAEILGGEWKTSFGNIGRFLHWMSAYLRPELLSLAVMAAFLSRRPKMHWLLHLSWLCMAVPLILLGKTLHPRYFLPVAPFFTLSAALFLAEAWKYVRNSKTFLATTTFLLIVAFFVVASLRFAFMSWLLPDQTPFVMEDRGQYLTDWSSGHGIPQVRDFLIKQVAEGKKVTVATEGSFGTLPDGLLMYFDKRPEIQSLHIEGLAQYPVKSLPEWVLVEAAEHPTYLLVNEHRFELNADQQPLVKLEARYPRPYGAPELHLYRVEVESD